MPTFLAIILACLSAFLAHAYLKEYSLWLSAFASLLIWILVFYFVKKFVSGIRP